LKRGQVQGEAHAASSAWCEWSRWRISSSSMLP
jgi:hypothetical protein